MSKRNGPSARAHGFAGERPRSGGGGASPEPAPVGQRYSRGESLKQLALQEAVVRAEGDYQRLRSAYVELAEQEPGHEVALAMIGADMARAHARLQALSGLPRLPFTPEHSAALRREAQRQPGENP